MKRVSFVLRVTAALMLGGASVVRAAAIGNPNAANGWDATSAISVTASQAGYVDRGWENTINGTGLDAETGTLHAAGIPHGSMGVGPGTANPRGGTIYTTEDPNDSWGDRWIEYSFDQVYELERMDIWAYNENADWFWSAFAIKDVTIEVSTTGGTNPAEWTMIAQTFFNCVPALLAPVTTQIDFGGVDAQYVVITLKNGNEGTYINNLQLSNQDFGLSEVRFYDTTYTGPATCGDSGTVYKAGDVNKDCYVNLLDLSVLANEWFHCSDPASSNCDPYWQ